MGKIDLLRHKNENRNLMYKNENKLASVQKRKSLPAPIQIPKSPLAPVQELKSPRAPVQEPKSARDPVKAPKSPASLQKPTKRGEPEPEPKSWWSTVGGWGLKVLDYVPSLH